MPEPDKHLILGGARSGKSGFAEQHALSMLDIKHWVYIATADAGDGEMDDRIRQHRADRDQRWRTAEEPIHLASALSTHDATRTCILVDCLTLWLSNCLVHDCWAVERDALIEHVRTSQGRLLLVSNEVGSGVVPLGQMSRQFVDESGRLHQQLAQHCDRVTLVTAGLPLTLKGRET